MTNSARGLRNQCVPKRSSGRTIIDAQTGTAVLQFTRGRGLERQTKIVHAASAGQPGIEGRVEYRLARLQKRLHVFEGERLQKIFRRDAGPVRKQSVKMKRAQADALRERVQIGLLRMMSI